ncbi:hypothetical protein [Fluviicola sp.]|uniref:hypothetical protein n=1 Tax=Fluviicola sp. TaxID=1917219 RepID=UPI00260373A8|nr:hypothetical protein [Fluviicola sp.]
MNSIRNHLFVAIVLICCACSENKSEKKIPVPKEEIALFTPYEQMQNAQIYLDKTLAFNTDSIPSDTLFFIPLNSCDKCIDLILNSLLANEFSGAIVFGGNIKDKPIFEKQYKALMQKHTCLVDENYVMYKYDLDIYGPTLLIRSGKSPLVAHLDFTNWKDVLKELRWK